MEEQITFSFDTNTSPETSSLMVWDALKANCSCSEKCKRVEAALIHMLWTCPSLEKILERCFPNLISNP